MINEIEHKIVCAKDTRQKLLQKRGDINHQIKIQDGVIACLEAERESKKQRGIVISEHAIQRFRERIMDVPKSVAKKALDTDGLLKRYLKNGDGEYKINGIYAASCVIRDYTVVTCYSSVNIEKQFEEATKYIHYRIDCYCAQALGEVVDIMTIHKFRKYLYH